MNIKNVNDEYLDVEVIRYFKNDSSKYLIYSLNEADEMGLVKLYASKIIDSKACIITDDDEWVSIKEIIKKIVRNNRDGEELTIEDLDEDELNDITLQNTRVFKLQGNLVTLLAENKHVLKKEPVVDEIIDEKIDYETMYAEQLNKNAELQNEINELRTTIEKYQQMINSVKDLLEE